MTPRILPREECPVTGLEKILCFHCDEEAEPDKDDIEERFEIIGRVFDAQFPGRCTLDYSHKIKRGESVARVQRSDNPMIPVTGVACYRCVRMLPRSAE